MSDDVQEPGESLVEDAGIGAFDWTEFEVDEEEEEGSDVLRFDVGGRSFAILTEHVVEVAAPSDVVPIPGVPTYVRGVAVRRQSVVTVIDLARFLDLRPARTARSRFLILRVNALDVAVEVDSVSGLELWPLDEESTKLLSDVDDRVREFAVGARWAPGGVVVLLDTLRVLERASVR